MRIGHAILASLALLATAGSAYGAGGAGSETPTQPGSTLQMAMTLYAGGVTLGKVDLNTTIRGDQYHSVSNLQTSGIVNAFWQSEIQATSTGTVAVANKSIHPGLYDSFYTGHADKKQEVSLTYDNGGPVRLYADPTYPTTGYEVPPAQQKGTFDPLSAITYFISGVGASADNPCSVLLPVFDGRRRYDVEFVKVKDTNVALDNGIYKGPAVLCEMKYKQISGYKPRVLKDASKFPLINAWITTVPSAVTGRRYVVPLRIWANTEYGVIAGVATQLKVDGVTPKPAG
jgi:hypothetical protein